MSTAARALMLETPTQAGCRVGLHQAIDKVTIDAGGIEHSRCRYCGCTLIRLPTIGRWYLSGELG